MLNRITGFNHDINVYTELSKEARTIATCTRHPERSVKAIQNYNRQLDIDDYGVFDAKSRSTLSREILEPSCLSSPSHGGSKRRFVLVFISRNVHERGNFR